MSVNNSSGTVWRGRLCSDLSGMMSSACVYIKIINNHPGGLA